MVKYTQNLWVNRESVTQLLKILKEFKANCELEIPTIKADALWLGFLGSCKKTPYNFKWPKEPVQALGVHFSFDQEHPNKLWRRGS